jgi:hypothetical protein
MREYDSLGPCDVGARHVLNASDALRSVAVRQLDDYDTCRIPDVNMRRRMFSWREQHRYPESMHAEHRWHGHIMLTQGLRLSNQIAALRVENPPPQQPHGHLRRGVLIPRHDTAPTKGSVTLVDCWRDNQETHWSK